MMTDAEIKEALGIIAEGAAHPPTISDENSNLVTKMIYAARILLPKAMEELKLNRALQAAYDAVTRVPEKTSLTPHDVFMFGYNIGKLIDENEKLMRVKEAAFEAMLDLNHIRCDGGDYEGPGGDKEVATRAEKRIEDALKALGEDGK